jgi:hypothetical protein
MIDDDDPPIWEWCELMFVCLFVVIQGELMCKLGAMTLETRIKGVYDLLVPKEDQTRYCRRDKGCC